VISGRVGVVKLEGNLIGIGSLVEMCCEEDLALVNALNSPCEEELRAWLVLALTGTGGDWSVPL
jgi:hypothetical protein